VQYVNEHILLLIIFQMYFTICAVLCDGVKQHD